MKTIVVIQARMSSSRLFGKVLLPLGETVMLNYVVTRCRQIRQAAEVIVATTTSLSDELIVEWCNRQQVRCFRGAEEDVLFRYYECARNYQADYIVRVTADCPFVDYDMANEIVELMNRRPCDMVRIVDELKLTRGLVAEIISFPCLEFLQSHVTDPEEREHVTYHVKRHIDQFHTIPYTAPDYYYHSQLRVTVDTEADYELCRKIAERFPEQLLVPSAEVIDFLLGHPDIASINAHIKHKPVHF